MPGGAGAGAGGVFSMVGPKGEREADTTADGRASIASFFGGDAAELDDDRTVASAMVKPPTTMAAMNHRMPHRRDVGFTFFRRVRC